MDRLLLARARHGVALVLAILALLGVIGLALPTPMAAATGSAGGMFASGESMPHVYDASIDARVLSLARESAEAARSGLSRRSPGSARLPVVTESTSTTSFRPFIATNTVDDAMAGVRAAGAQGEAQTSGSCVGMLF